jgi:hypothetical protein
MRARSDKQEDVGSSVIEKPVTSEVHENLRLR